jgi:hypothetical protein
VQDLLLKGADTVLVPFRGDSSVGLLVSDGLEESIGDTLELGCIEVGLCLECSLNGVWGEGEWCWGRDEARR